MATQPEAGALLHAQATMDQALAACSGGEWERARALLAPLAADACTLPAEALEVLAVCQLKLGAMDDACRTMERAFAGFVAEGQTRRAVQAAAHLVALNEILGAEAACEGWERRGLRLLEESGPCVEQGYLALARTGCEIHDPAELEARADLALQLAQQFGDQDLALRARAEKGLALVCQGFVNAGFALLDEVMVSIAAGELRSADMRGRSVCSMLSACERTGDVARAEYWCRRIEQEQTLQHVLLGTHCRVTYGVVAALRGEWQRAETLLTDVLQDTWAVPYHRAVSAGRLAEILIQQGKPALAAEVLQGCEEHLEAVPALARLRTVEGQYGQAVGLLHALIRGLGQDTIRLAPALAQLVEIELRRDDRAAAEHALQRLRGLAQRCEGKEIQAYARLAEGRVARHTGDLDLAVEALETALTLLARYERPLLVAQIRLELARVLRDRHVPGQALVEAEAALATFRRVGVVTDAAAAEGLIATLAGAVPHPAPVAPRAGDTRGPRAHDGRLTRREADVAALVAEGLTNREIADRLVLSVRTVEGHIDRVLGKLGFHTRTELAVWVSQTQA